MSRFCGLIWTVVRSSTGSRAALEINSIIQVKHIVNMTPVPSGTSTVNKIKPRTDCKRILVTGGAGFVVSLPSAVPRVPWHGSVGSHLCDYLVARGDYVSKLQSKGVCLPIMQENALVNFVRRREAFRV
eukprot:825867-Pelagomonas_calceolata.AAC.11